MQNLTPSSADANTPNSPRIQINVAACPNCGSLTHRSQQSWWHRWIYGHRSIFHCQSCQKRFSRWY